MATSKSDPISLTGWQAAGAKELRKIWEDLRTDSIEEGTERKFRGRNITPGEAGDVFERWVLEAFRLSGMTGHYAFPVSLRQSASTREQIDGVILDGWQGFLVESKFWTKGVDFGPIALFHAHVETRPAGTMGLFFSAFGFTAPALEPAELLRPFRVLLFDGDDLKWALTSGPFNGRMTEMIRRKWVLALKDGLPHRSVSDTIDLFN
ncbi:MAG TPA: restriction endonuclease [Gemmataceae bacterium]|nr:restriction endonuclease [Gemmataceae bacterium]